MGISSVAPRHEGLLLLLFLRLGDGIYATLINVSASVVAVWSTLLSCSIRVSRALGVSAPAAVGVETWAREGAVEPRRG